MADLVIDEWLWSDLAAENTVERQRQAFQFLQAVFIKCDRIVIVKGSKFESKANALWKHTDVTRRYIARFYKDRFLYNSDKSQLLEESQLQNLPAPLASEVNVDDQYLVQALIAANASSIITTDNPLIDILARHGLSSEHRDTFVSTYISRYWQG